MTPEAVFIHQELLGKRMDPTYWMPHWKPTYSLLESWKPNLAEFGDFIPKGAISYGQVGSREYDIDGEVLYLQARNIPRSCTGIDPHAKYARVRAGGRNDPARSRIAPGDLLLVRSGIGSIGRAVAVLSVPEPANISQHICRITLSNLDPCYAALFLISRFGQEQIARQLSGVGTHEIDFDEIRSLLIPMPDKRLIRNIKDGYTSMRKLHDEAMQKRERPVKAAEALRILIQSLEDAISSIVTESKDG